MTFKVGDVVQVTQDEILPTNDRRYQERNYLFGMIGIVTEVTDQHVLAFFNCGPFHTDEDLGLEGVVVGYFAPSDLTKVGTAIVQPDYTRIKSRLVQVQQAARDHYMKNPQTRELILRMEKRGKYRELLPGSEEAKKQGCICEEIRNDDCVLHAFSVAEAIHTEYITEKALEEKP